MLGACRGSRDRLDGNTWLLQQVSRGRAGPVSAVDAAKEGEAYDWHLVPLGGD